MCKTVYNVGFYYQSLQEIHFIFICLLLQLQQTHLFTWGNQVIKNKILLFVLKFVIKLINNFRHAISFPKSHFRLKLYID